MGLKVVFWVVWASAICCSGQSVVGCGMSGVGVVVAKMSMPLLSMPKKTSRPFSCRLGIMELPVGTLPGGAILRKIGVAGSPVIEKLLPLGVADKLLQVFRTSMFDVELPPAMKANAPVEENAMASAGAVRG